MILTQIIPGLQNGDFPSPPLPPHLSGGITLQRRALPFPPCTKLSVYYKADSWIPIIPVITYSVGYNPLLFLFILSLKLSQIWPATAPSRWFLYLLDITDHICLLSGKTKCSRLNLCLPFSSNGINLVSQGPPVLRSGEWYNLTLLFLVWHVVLEWMTKWMKICLPCGAHESLQSLKIINWLFLKDGYVRTEPLTHSCLQLTQVQLLTSSLPTHACTFHSEMSAETHWMVLVIQKALGEANLSQPQGPVQAYYWWKF